MSLTILQHGVGKLEQLHKMFGRNTQDWAAQWNCGYVFSNQRVYEGVREPHWEKPHFVYGRMLDAAEDEIFLWMDPDTWVKKKEVSPVGVLKPWADMAMAMDRATPFNSGLFFIRNNERTRAYMKAVVDLGNIDGAGFHDQSRMCEQLQFHEIRLQVLPWEWNSAHCTNCFRGKEEIQPPIILAFHGWPKRFVELAMAQEMQQKRFKISG